MCCACVCDVCANETHQPRSELSERANGILQRGERKEDWEGKEGKKMADGGASGGGGEEKPRRTGSSRKRFENVRAERERPSRTFPVEFARDYSGWTELECSF